MSRLPSVSGSQERPRQLSPPGLEYYACSQSEQQVPYYTPSRCPPPPPPIYLSQSSPAHMAPFPPLGSFSSPTGPYVARNAAGNYDNYQQWYHTAATMKTSVNQVDTRRVKRRKLLPKVRHRGSVVSPSITPVANSREKQRSKRRRPNRKLKSKLKSKDPDLFVHPKYFLAANSIGSSEADIERWIAQRRKKFPRSRRNPNISADCSTAQNIAARSPSAVAVSPPTVEDSAKRVIARTASSAANAPGHRVEARDAMKQSTLVSPEKSRKQREICFKYNRGACRRETSCRYKHDNIARSKHMIEARKKSERRMYLKLSGREPGSTSLVRKLLMNEVKLEELLILETIRFLCENEFLQSG